MGINNIIIRDKQLSDEELEEVRAKFSRGLSVKDADAIQKIVPTVATIAPQAELEMETKYQDKSVKATIVGVTAAYGDILNYELSLGKFLTNEHHTSNMRVCVLGADVAKSLFPVEVPLGKLVKIGDQWFEVVGIMNIMLATVLERTREIGIRRAMGA